MGMTKVLVVLVALSSFSNSAVANSVFANRVANQLAIPKPNKALIVVNFYEYGSGADEVRPNRVGNTRLKEIFLSRSENIDHFSNLSSVLKRDRVGERSISLSDQTTYVRRVTGAKQVNLNYYFINNGEGYFESASVLHDGEIIETRRERRKPTGPKAELGVEVLLKALIREVEVAVEKAERKIRAEKVANDLVD
jgi:hypothetical protein